MSDPVMDELEQELEQVIERATRTGISKGIGGVGGDIQRGANELIGSIGLGGRGTAGGMTGGILGKAGGGLEKANGLAGIWGGIGGGGIVDVLGAMRDSSQIVQGGVLGKIFGAGAGIMGGPVGWRWMHIRCSRGFLGRRGRMSLCREWTRFSGATLGTGARI